MGYIHKIIEHIEEKVAKHFDGTIRSSNVTLVGMIDSTELSKIMENGYIISAIEPLSDKRCKVWFVPLDKLHEHKSFHDIDLNVEKPTEEPNDDLLLECENCEHTFYTTPTKYVGCENCGSVNCHK